MSDEPKKPITPAPLRPSVSEQELARHRRQRMARRRLGRWLKRGALSIAAAGIAGALAYAWLPEPVEVDIGRAHRGELSTFVEEDGRTRVRDRFTVSAPLAGDLVRMELEPGDAVIAGAVIARILPPDPALMDERTRADAEARLAAAIARERQARARIPTARASAEVAEREAERARTLFSAGAISASERDRRVLDAATADEGTWSAVQEQRVAAAEVKTATAALGRLGGPAGSRALEVTAPVAGEILRLHRESEGPIAAGAPIVDIGDRRGVEAVVDVLSIDATRIAPGMPAWLEAWGGARPLSARVRQVEPSAFTRVSALGVEEQRVNVILAIESAPSELGDGYRIEARIQTWRGESLLMVPASAVFRQGRGWAVYAVEHGKAQLRPIEVGHRGRLDVEVTGGLAEGSPVILYPTDRIRDGVEVRSR